MRNLILTILTVLACGTAYSFDDGFPNNLSCKNPGPEEVKGTYCGVGGPYEYDCDDDHSYSEALSRAKVDAYYAGLAQLKDFTGVTCKQDCDDPDLGCSLGFASGILLDSDNYQINNNKKTCTVTVKFCVKGPKVKCGPCLAPVDEDEEGDK